MPGLHDLAVSAGVGVLNTWGAKGVFDWRSRHHLATIGLQADDFVLSGLDQADLIIATGLDHGRVPRRPLAAGPRPHDPSRRPGPPRRTDRSTLAASPLTMPPLRARLAEVTQRGWAAGTQPLSPSRATMHYAERVAGGALVAADAGDAGFWVARTLGTTRLGAVIVPSTSSPGFAAACVAVSLLRHPGRPALGRDRPRPGRGDGSGRLCGGDARGSVFRSRPGTPTATVSMPMPIGSGCAGCVLGGVPAGNGPCTLATDPRQLSEMIEVAGPIVAWT